MALAAVSASAAASTAEAETLNCRAIIPIRQVYDVSVDLDSGALNVRAHSDTTVSGIASRLVNGSSGATTFFLPTGFSAQQTGYSGVSVEVENDGRYRVALCLSQNSCYPCNRL